MRKLLVVLTAVFILQGSSMALAQIRSDLKTRQKRNTRQSRAERRKARIRKTMRILNEPVESVSWEDEALEDLIEEYFKGKYGLQNFIFSWKVIENSGANVDPSSAVTLSLTDTTVGAVLDLLLEQLSSEADTDGDRLTYHIIGGMVKISTKDHFNLSLFTKVYQVEHLYTLAHFWADAPEIRVEETDTGGGSGGGGRGGGGSGGGGGGSGRGGSGGGGGNIFGGGGSGGGGGGGGSGGGGGGSGGGGSGGGYIDFEEEREERQEKLLELLKQVRPETWDDAGGRGTISTFGGKIVITQTLEMHEIIGGRFAYTENLYP